MATHTMHNNICIEILNIVEVLVTLKRGRIVQFIPHESQRFRTISSNPLIKSTITAI